MATDVYELSRMAYICDIYRPSISDRRFSIILSWVCRGICDKAIDSMEYTREFYEEIANKADDIIIEAIRTKRSIERVRQLNFYAKDVDADMIQSKYGEQKNKKTSADGDTIKRVPQVIASYPAVVFDEFIEFIVGMKHYGGNPVKMDELDKEREEWERKKEKE